ncbi:hypothetical protein HK098_002706 [Nowakowskiella sp. JEL0407]|nr:hypothetical protein HK098_002706 [Nowakowskiella sp. JEL0407]
MMVSFSGINNEIYLKSARPLLPPPETLKHDIEDDGKSDDVDEYNADPCPIEVTIQKVTNEKYHEYCALAKQILSTNYAAVQFAREDLSYITSIKIYSRYPKWGWSLKPLPYQHYGGSTGSKKTQMGITMAFAFPDKPVFYFLLKDPADVHQRIYENFTSSASAFLECLNWIRRLLHQKTLHIGFIAELLKMLPEGNVRSLPEKMTTLQIVPLKGSEVLKVLLELNLYDHRPIFIIDGCRCSDLKKIKLVRYLRCVFPIVGLGLVIIGTDDRVARANFTINVGGGMRKRAKWWCTSIQQYPSFHLDYFRTLLTDELPDEVATILVHSRPWFSVLAMEYFREHGVSRVNFADTMNKAIKEVFGIILVSKKLSSHHSSLAQMQFLLKVQLANNDPYEEQHIITDHFGLLYPRNNTKLREDELTKENQKQWKSSSEIPPRATTYCYI